MARIAPGSKRAARVTPHVNDMAALDLCTSCLQDAKLIFDTLSIDLHVLRW